MKLAKSGLSCGSRVTAAHVDAALQVSVWGSSRVARFGFLVRGKSSIVSCLIGTGAIG